MKKYDLYKTFKNNAKKKFPSGKSSKYSTKTKLSVGKKNLMLENKHFPPIQPGLQKYLIPKKKPMKKTMYGTKMYYKKSMYGQMAKS